MNNPHCAKFLHPLSKRTSMPLPKKLNGASLNWSSTPPTNNSGELTADHSQRSGMSTTRLSALAVLPSPDGITYSVWSSGILSAIFSICVTSERILTAWKKSTTILIYKKNDLHQTGGQSPCWIYLARCLVHWATTNDKLCTQKPEGFSSVRWHSFLMESHQYRTLKEEPLHILAGSEERLCGSCRALMWMVMYSLGVPSAFLTGKPSNVRIAWLVVVCYVQACSQEFAQGGSDLIEMQESHTYFCFLRLFFKKRKRRGKICQN